MINDGQNMVGGGGQQQALIHISAKEFSAKYKSKRGKCSSAVRGPIFGDGIILWQVSPGLNLFRREATDEYSFLFHSEIYNFCAVQCEIYLPPYGKYSIYIFLRLRCVLMMIPSIQTTSRYIS